MQKRKRKVYFISLSHSFKSAILPVVLIWKKTISDVLCWCSTFCLQPLGNWQDVANMVINFPVLQISGICRLAEKPVASQEGFCPRAMGQLVSQSVSYNTLRMLGPISLCLKFISLNFQVTFTETSFIFKILTKFHCTISSDMLRCLAFLWLSCLPFKTTYFIISTFTFITENLNYIYYIYILYILSTHIPSSRQVINSLHNSAWHFSFIQNWKNYSFHKHFNNSYTIYPHQDLLEVTAEQNKP